MALIGGAEGTGDPDRPEQCEGQVEIAVRRALDHEPARVKRHQRGDESCAHQELQLWLKTPRAEVVLKPAGQSPGQGYEYPIEDPLPIEMAQQGRPSLVTR